MEPSRNLRHRAFAFAVDAVALYRLVSLRDRDLMPLARQMIRAGASIAANLEEAQAGQTRKDFIAKTCIALKEARETRYWLRLLRRCSTPLRDGTAPLIAESDELIAMLTAAVNTARRGVERTQRSRPGDANGR